MKDSIFQFIKFSIIGAINTLLHILILYILVEFFSVYYLIASLFGFLVAVVNSFILNSKFTFKSDLKKRTYIKFFKFFALSTLALLVNIFVLYISTEYFEIWYIYSQIIATLFSLSLNFVGNKYWTFADENQ